MTKLVLRRSNALLKLKEYGRAIDSLHISLEIDPSNTFAKSLMEQAKTMSEKEEKRMKNFYKNMFKALGTDEATKSGKLSKIKSFMFSRKLLLLALVVGFIGILIHLLWHIQY